MHKTTLLRRGAGCIEMKIHDRFESVLDKLIFNSLRSGFYKCPPAENPFQMARQNLYICFS